MDGRRAGVSTSRDEEQAPAPSPKLCQLTHSQAVGGNKAVDAARARVALLDPAAFFMSQLRLLVLIDPFQFLA